MKSPRLSSFAYAVFFIGGCALLQWAIGAYKSDHSQAGDEASYFVTSFMIRDYLAGHLFENPMAFAKDYYAHFPRIGFGHYPPAPFGIEAILLLIFGRDGAVIVAFQAVIAGLCAAFPAAIIARASGRILGLIAGIGVLASPYLLFGVGTDMADNLLALLVVLTALTWSDFYRTPSWGRGVLFAAAATTAILTKGTALGLAFLPVIHTLLKRNPFLVRPRTLLIGALVAIPTFAWYLLTYKLAAAGFLYTWGYAYTKLAAPFFSNAFVQSVGVPLTALYICGVALSAMPGIVDDKIDVHAFVGASLPMLIFPMFAPADLMPRYVIPAVPSAIVVAVWAGWRLMAMLSSLQQKHVFRSAACAIAILVSVGSVFHPPHVEPFETPTLAAQVMQSGRKNPLVLVSASPNLEGAVIASFVERDIGKHFYVLRASAMLASDDFMGRNYHQRFDTVAALSDWIKRNEIGWVIIDGPGAPDEFAHTHLLREAIKSGTLGAVRVKSVHSNRDGGQDIELYALPAVDMVPNANNDLFLELRPSIQL